MAKVVALQHTAAGLAASLAAEGYKVMSLQDAQRFRTHVDAILYAARSPESMAARDTLEAADISRGYNLEDSVVGEALPCAVFLNITGLPPKQVLAELEHRLRHRPWRS